MYKILYLVTGEYLKSCTNKIVEFNQFDIDNLDKSIIDFNNPYQTNSLHILWIKVNNIILPVLKNHFEIVEI